MTENDNEPTRGLATLHHIDRVVEDRVGVAVRDHTGDCSPWKAEVERKLKELDARINDGFPDGDEASHRKVHEQYIQDAEDRREVRKSLLSHVMNAGFLGAMLIIANAVWEYIKAGVHK